MEKIVFLDNASTTKPFDEINKILIDYSNNFYNPSALYDVSVCVKKNIENARKNICKLLGGEEGTLYFTGSATEANNMALSSFNNHAGELAISKMEHPAVFNKAKALENAGVVVKYIDFDENGVNVENIDRYVSKNTAFVSIMHVSNETGIINNIKELTAKIKKINPKIIVHADGVQAFGKIPVDLMDLGVDMYTISAHKIHGVKGIGALWVKNGVKVSPIIFGGGQENGFRSGTENVAAIMAFEYAATKTVKDQKENFEKAKKQKEEFIKTLCNRDIKYIINGKNCSPYILSLSIDGIRGEVLVHSLEKYKIYISTGSACSSKKPDNRTLSALGRTNGEIKGSVRISFSAYEDFNIIDTANIVAKEIKDLLIKIKG